ncbi:MAG: hypothetical protein GY696_10670 [Gammaproteobacteria bacterium]|nr:hypothetical protein [Gammaproteobacteria bacterium]
MKIKFKIASTLALIAALMTSVAVADVRVRLQAGSDFVVEDRTATAGTGTDNAVIQPAGAGTQISRSTVSLSDGEVTGNSAGKIRLFEGSGGGSNSVTLKAPATLSNSWTLTLPATDGTAGQVLQTDGSGTTSWITQ